MRRASLLAHTGTPALPVVAGTWVTSEAANLARTQQVWQLTNGHAIRRKRDASTVPPERRAAHVRTSTVQHVGLATEALAPERADELAECNALPCHSGCGVLMQCPWTVLESPESRLADTCYECRCSPLRY